MSVLASQGGPPWLAGFLHGAPRSYVASMAALKSDAELLALHTHGFLSVQRWHNDPAVRFALEYVSDVDF